MTQKLLKVGSSAAVTIPKKSLKELGLKIGDEVRVAVNTSEKTVLGVRDIGRILSAAKRQKLQFAGKDLYPTVFDKAWAYFESIVFDHPFVDGNKRTALATAVRFFVFEWI